MEVGKVEEREERDMIRGMCSVDIMIFLLKWGDEKVRCELHSPRLHDYTIELASEYTQAYEPSAGSSVHCPCRDSSTRILIYNL